MTDLADLWRVLDARAIAQAQEDLERVGWVLQRGGGYRWVATRKGAFDDPAEPLRSAWGVAPEDVVEAMSPASLLEQCEARNRVRAELRDEDQEDAP